MKKILAASAVAGALALGAPAGAMAQGSVDVSVGIRAGAPVPGGFTAGSWSIANTSPGTMPAGASYVVKFTRMPSDSISGTTTVTTQVANATKVQRLSDNTYRIVLTQPLNPGQQVKGLWSDAHWFSIGQRDKVTISAENIPAGTTDTNSANDTATYDNSGQGF